MDCREERKSLGRCKEKMKSFRKSTRGLSPIFATLILIAIAVIAGIVVYMFTSGTIGSLTGSSTAGSEKMAIQTIEGSGNSIVLYAMSQSGGPIPLDSAILKETHGA